MMAAQDAATLALKANYFAATFTENSPKPLHPLQIRLVAGSQVRRELRIRPRAVRIMARCVHGERVHRKGRRRVALAAPAWGHKVGERARLARLGLPMALEDLKVEAEYLGRALHSDGRVHAPRLREALGAAANVKVPDLRRADARAVAPRDEPTQK